MRINKLGGLLWIKYWELEESYTISKLTHISHFGKGFADESDGEQEVDSRASSVRRFRLPKINLQTKQYNKLADLNEQDVGEPPVTQHLSTETIKDIMESPLTLGHPCHNQSVERHIKLVTEAFATVASYESRDGLIRQRIKSRRLMIKVWNEPVFHINCNIVLALFSCFVINIILSLLPSNACS